MKRIFVLLALLVFTVPTVVYGVGIDVNTKLMLHMDGIDGSTSFIDSSFSGHTVTPTGNTHIEADSSKFGGASGFFDGSGDYLTIPDSSDWDFGAGDFTIDFWAFNGDTSLGEGPQSQGIITRRDNNLIQSFAILKDSGEMRFRASATGSIWDVVLGMGTFDDSWHHYSVVRDGDVFTTFKDGLSQNSTTSNITLMDETGHMMIGFHQIKLNGYLDEVRISKGIARWTTDFTPSTEAYSTAEAVPEPTTVALLGIGLAGLAGGAVRRRFKRRSKS